MKTYRALLLALGLAIGLTVSAGAQTDDSSIAIYGGLTIFNNPAFDSVALVEFPFILNRHQFDFYRADSTSTDLETRIYAQVRVMNLQGIAVDSASTYFSARVASMQEAKTRNIRLFNQLGLALKPGLYSARLNVIDVVSKREGDIFYTKIEVPPLDSSHLTIGATNLAYAISPIKEGASEDRSNRNGFHVRVNPLHLFGPEDTLLGFYGEVYNLAFATSAAGKFRVGYYVVDAGNQVYHDYGFALREKMGTSAVLTQQFPIKGWPVGKYGLYVTVADEMNGHADTVFLPFRIAEQPGQATLVEPTSVNDPYDSLKLDDKLNLVYYLLTPVEKRIIEDLRPEGKENFLRQYWREHDSDPSTLMIENRNEMIQRYRYANERYSTNMARTDGWFSDRGRIYMLYGQWDERDDIPTPIKGNPFEIWFYRHAKKSLLFVFEDRQGNQDLKLVHSNADGEIYSDDWQTVVDEGLYNVK